MSRVISVNDEREVKRLSRLFSIHTKCLERTTLGRIRDHCITRNPYLGLEDSSSCMKRKDIKSNSYNDFLNSYERTSLSILKIKQCLLWCIVTMLGTMRHIANKVDVVQELKKTTWGDSTTDTTLLPSYLTELMIAPAIAHKIVRNKFYIP